MTTIIAILVGALLVLTVENTIMIHRKPKKEHVEVAPERRNAEDEQEQEEWHMVMNYQGRNK